MYIYIYIYIYVCIYIYFHFYTNGKSIVRSDYSLNTTVRPIFYSIYTSIHMNISSSIYVYIYAYIYILSLLHQRQVDPSLRIFSDYNGALYVCLYIHVCI